MTLFRIKKRVDGLFKQFIFRFSQYLARIEGVHETLIVLAIYEVLILGFTLQNSIVKNNIKSLEEVFRKECKNMLLKEDHVAFGSS